MRWVFCFVLCLSLLQTAPSAEAQDAIAEPLSIEEAGSDYLRSIRLRRIDPGVGYYDPSAPPPALDTRQDPDRLRERGEGEVIELRWPTVIVAAAILLAILYILYRFGGGISVSLGGDAGNPGRHRNGRRASGEEVETPASLDSILRLGDRREALVLLARKVLAATVAANGVLLQRSWTARDALRHIPREQRHLDDLRALVLASERVQFGGRDVTAEEFDDHLRRIHPLLPADPA